MPIGLVHDHVFTDEEWQQYRKDNPPCIAAMGYEPVDDYKNSLPEELRVSLTFELTYACSERCLHCFNEGAARSDLHEEHRLRPDMLTLDDYKRIIDEAVALGIPKVTVTGGDPFSYPRHSRLFARAQSGCELVHQRPGAQQQREDTPFGPHGAPTVECLHLQHRC